MWTIQRSARCEFNTGLFRGSVTAEAVIAATSFTADDAFFDGNVHAQGMNLEFGLTVAGALEVDNPPGATPPSIGFFGVPAITRPTVTGDRSSGTALTDLLQTLESLGLVVDGTVA